jgi:hypothetical protein
MSDCIDPKVVTHEVEWQPDQCVDGGILRAKRTYTNLAVSGFNTDIGYSGHYYGIRKYTGLIPQSPYFISLEGKTGQGGFLDVPREIYEWEYGSNDNVDYSGVKIPNPSGQSNQFYGKSVSVSKDYMSVGMPFYSFFDTEGNLLNNAGTVFVYKRNPQPSGSDWSDQYDKANWVLDQQVNLPSGIFRDYVYETFESNRLPNINVNLPFNLKKRSWRVGQNGRQLGHSVDLCSVNGEKSLGENEKNLLVVSGPSCKFDRTFIEIVPSSVPVGLFILTDNFEPSTTLYFGPGRSITYDYNYVDASVKDLDLLFRYFAKPATKFDIKIDILDCQPDSSTKVSPDFPEPKPSFVKKSNSRRHKGLRRVNDPAFLSRDEDIFESLKDAFFTSFPYDESKFNNNIPAILGFFIDTSLSFQGEKSVQPALDRFINFYKQYSFASGLKNIDGSPATGYTFKFLDENDYWAQSASSLLRETLKIESLQLNDTYKLFANEIGSINPEANELNEIPYSGGCVYIFEKESGVWNLIQNIESPTKLKDVHPDRFGHCVRISDNGEIVVIGSPYLGSNNVMAYERDEREKDRLYGSLESWLVHRVNNETLNDHYSKLLNKLEQYKQQFPKYLDAIHKFYIELSSTDKFRLRSDKDYWGDFPIQEYKETFIYSNPINAGAWDFLINEVAPSPRLGYSVAVNEDGSIIAAGSPTDSFNEFDEAASYFAPGRSQYSTWPAYINAGSVRVFESRKYFPHDTVVDYGKFGNLHYEISNQSEHQYFNHLESIYESTGLKFIQTEFPDPNIPEEAGLLFIRTPQVDALSDEVFENIQSWLALGDRHLVVVGNDPIWESSGIYLETNNIINKLLRRLDSGLVLTPARNEYEASLVLDENRPNIVPSFRPAGTLDAISNIPLRMFGSGVADIKPYFPNFTRTYDCSPKKDLLSLSSIFDEDLTYRSANSKCEIPIYHLGDMRSEWGEWCLGTDGRPRIYPVNWPMVFGVVKPSRYGCAFGENDSNDSVSPLATYNFSPLMVASEYPKPYIVTIPERPIESGYLEVGQNQVGSITELTKEFDEVADSGIAFIWSSQSGNFTYLNTNFNNVGLNYQFYDPEEYNAKDAVLQGKAVQKIETINEGKVASDKAYFCAEEKYENTNSKVILIAGTHAETERVLNSNLNYALRFYNNILAKDSENGSLIAQLGDWVGRSSLTDLNPNSVLGSYIEGIFSEINMNVSTDTLLSGASDGTDYDICWILEPLSLPSELELSKLRSWLGRGNKKLIIVYQNYNDVAAINRIGTFCDLLNVSMKPLFLTEKSRYATKKDIFPWSSSQSLGFNLNNFISKGPDGAGTSIEYLPPPEDFIPINLGNANPVCFLSSQVIDDSFVDRGFWELHTGIAKVNFPITPGSGYKIFFTTASEHISEQYPLYCSIDNVSPWPSSQKVPPAFVTMKAKNEAASFDGSALETKSITFYPNPEKDFVSVNIYTNEYFPDQSFDIRRSFGFSPKTTRLISISGCLVPLVDRITTRPIYEPVFDWVITDQGSPEQQVTVVPDPRPISTDNTKYCPNEIACEGLGNQLIADGPVVVAQEIEKFSDFEHGVNRSRITVISDSSLIQGRSIADDNGSIYSNVINFLLGLYPYTRFPSETRGRSYKDFITKIQSYERSNPSILFNSTGNQGNNLRFQTQSAPASGRLLSEYVVSFDKTGFKPAGSVEDYKGPTYLVLKELPRKTPSEVIIEKSGLIQGFKSSLSSWGSNSKFAGEINGKYYEDIGPNGGIPEIMKDTGYDYLDFDKIPSGYPGDLFGYSIDIYKNKLLIGSPFSIYGSENTIYWNDVVNNTSRYNKPSGSIVGFNGGAGSAYLYERIPGKSGVTPFGNATRWSLSRKFRPQEINIGQDSNNLNTFLLPETFGENNYKANDLSLSIVNDQFGHSVQIYSDMIAIGAPGHDFDNYVDTIFESGAFIRKEFDSSIDIPQRIIYNLGSSGNRALLPNSGVSVLNNGAVFTYENRIKYWQDKTQEWKLIEKIVPQGYNARQQKFYVGSQEIPVSGSENDRFGSIVNLDRQKRSDSDYCLAIGVPEHKFGASGDPVINMGSIYTYDGMLRRMPPSKIDGDSFINARVFGDTINQNPIVSLNFYNSGSDISLFATGIIYSNNQGEIFIEASGQDIVDKLYIRHRPYIKAVYGKYVFGEQSTNNINLFVDGEVNKINQNINLAIKVPDSDIVYNNLGLYQAGILGFASGIPSGLSLYLYSPEATQISDQDFKLYTSGTAIGLDSINLRVRGK